jgi:hypothetical protein
VQEPERQLSPGPALPSGQLEKNKGSPVLLEKQTSYLLHTPYEKINTLCLPLFESKHAGHAIAHRKHQNFDLDILSMKDDFLYGKPSADLICDEP